MWTELTSSEYRLMAGCYEYSEELLISKNSVRLLVRYTPDWIESGSGCGGDDYDNSSEYLIRANNHLLDLLYREVIIVVSWVSTCRRLRHHHHHRRRRHHHHHHHHHQCCFVNERGTCASRELLRIQGIQDSNMHSETDYSDWRTRRLWVSSFPPGKRRGGISNYTTTASFHIPSNVAHYLPLFLTCICAGDKEKRSNIQGYYPMSTGDSCRRFGGVLLTYLQGLCNLRRLRLHRPWNVHKYLSVVTSSCPTWLASSSTQL